MSELIKEGISIVSEAVTADQAHDSDRAIALYTKALAKFDAALASQTLKPKTAQTTTKKRDEYAARLAHLRAEADVNADADNENDPVRAAKVALNDAMEADRAHRYEEAIEKYRSGIGLLLALRGDATHGQWAESEARRHLARAETLKTHVAAVSRETSNRGVDLLAKADEAWHAHEFANALSLYERAREALLDEPDHSVDQLAHCSKRIELLIERDNHGGEFQQPVRLGLRPGEKYVDPIEPPSKFDRFKNKTIKLKKKIDQKLADDPW